MKTPRRVSTLSKCSGSYTYYGIEKAIRLCLSKNEWYAEHNSSIRLIVNVDGIPLFKSAPEQLWPVLISFGPFKPVIAALYLGGYKPSSVHEFLADFISEVYALRQSGISFNGKSLTVSIKCFSCDVPARAFLKCIKGHAGYHSCERCMVVGKSEARRLVMPATDASERTDEGFKALEYMGTHQTQVSPLLDGFSCVLGFVLDYMHLVCLGVTRRLLCYLKRGPRVCRLSIQQLTRISDQLVSFKNVMPSEFARNPRSLDELDRWKATEFRQFLLYTGAVVLKNQVSEDIYQHFLLLSTAFAILLDPVDVSRQHYLEFSRQLLIRFVDSSSRVYGPTFPVHNVHSLIHLPDDAANYSCSLDDLNCFPFENCLQGLKKIVRNSKNPIAQIIKRIVERTSNAPPEYFLKSSDFSKVSTNQRDACFAVGEEFVFLKQERRKGFYSCQCYKKATAKSFYTLRLGDSSCPSDRFGIVFLKESCESKRKIIHKRQLTTKIVALPYRDGFVLTPLRHGDEH
jgi:hypothetical protein